MGGLVQGIAGLAGTVATTAVGAVLAWLGTVLQGLAVIANGIVSLLPDATDLGLNVGGGWLYGFALANQVIPLTETLAYVMVLTTLYIAGITWRLAVIAYHLIPKPLSGT